MVSEFTTSTKKKMSYVIEGWKHINTTNTSYKAIVLSTSHTKFAAHWQIKIAEIYAGSLFH